MGEGSRTAELGLKAMEKKKSNEVFWGLPKSHPRPKTLGSGSAGKGRSDAGERKIEGVV